MLVIALVCPAQEVEIAVNKIGVEERKTLVEVFGTVVEVAVAGIAYLFRVGIGLLKPSFVFEKVEQIGGSGPT